MTSEFRIIKYLEWCPELPSTDCPRKTHVFTVDGDEWLFRLHLEKAGENWYYNLYLEVKCKNTEFEPCRFKLQIGFKKKENLTLGDKTCEVSKPCNKEIWCISLNNLKSMLPSDYLLGNGIKFLFCFDNTAEYLLKMREENGRTQEDFAGCHSHQESQTSPALGTNFHFEALSRDLSKLLDEGLRCDVEIMCESKTFHAHRIILGLRSTVFSAMLESNMVEGETGVIKVEDFNACTFQSFLRYLYSGTLPELNVETSKQFYEIADKYAVEELKKACSEFLIKNLSEISAYEILVLADKHSDQDFRKEVISYIVDKKIPQSDCQWNDFCENYCKLAIEVQNLYIKKYCPK